MARKFTVGMSGGQRKLMLSELICQRTASQFEILIVLDPISRITDDVSFTNA